MAAPLLANHTRPAMPYVVIWDVKTIPDLRTFAAAKGLGSRNEDQLRAAMAEELSSPLYRSIVCLGMLMARIDSDRWIVDSIRSWSQVENFPERLMIKRFFDTIADLKAATVTFNGGAILQYRAMREKLSYPRYSIEPYTPYALENLSLCDVLSPDSKRRISLRAICAVLDMPFDGLDDDDVERYAQQERFMEIAKEQLYWRDRKLNGPKSHIDYCCIPDEWINSILDVAVSKFDDWVDIDEDHQGTIESIRKKVQVFPLNDAVAVYLVKYRCFVTFK